MTFEYIDESDQEPLQKASHLGMGLLFKRKFGEVDGEYRPPADELVGDIEAYLKERSDNIADRITRCDYYVILLPIRIEIQSEH
jgi:hypothetical protein